MSGIAELLVNLGYKVSGSDMQRTDITDRLESLGARITQGHDARNVERRGGRGVFVGGASDQSRNGGCARARPGCGSARGDPRGAHAAASGHRRRRRAREDDDDLDDRPRARRGWPRSDGRHRRPRQLIRQQRQARTRQVSRRGSRRERSVVPEAVTTLRRHHEHRSRASRGLSGVRRPESRLRAVRQRCSCERRRDHVRRRCRI